MNNYTGRLDSTDFIRSGANFREQQDRAAENLVVVGVDEEKERVL